MRPSVLTILAVCMALLASGCMTQMSGIAPSTTPITEKDTYTVLGHAEGRAWGAVLLFIPIFEPDPSRTARDRAIDAGGGNAMIEVAEDVNMLWLYLVSIYWTHVEGTAVNVARGAAKR